MPPTSRSSSEELPRAPEMLDHHEQNEWINARMRQIQELWHDLFDADPGVYASENPRPAPLPRHPDEDHRLMFGLLGIAPATRKACYALLPEGEEMWRRFELHVSSPPTELSQADARPLIAQLAELAAGVAPHSRVEWDQVTFAAESDSGIVDRMNTTGDVDDLLDMRRGSQRGRDPASLAATYFLSDAHYYAAGNHYQLHHWVCGAMHDEAVDQISEILYRLRRSHWQVFCDEDGVLLVNRGA